MKVKKIISLAAICVALSGCSVVENDENAKLNINAEPKETKILEIPIESQENQSAESANEEYENHGNSTEELDSKTNNLMANYITKSYEYGYPFVLDEVNLDVNGKKHTFVWDEPSYKSCLFAIKNAKSSNIVVVTRDTGGTGMGTIDINAFTFSDNIYELSLPSFETAYGYAQGFLATAPYSDNYCLTVLVEDTGFFGRLSLPENDFFDYSMYDDQGVCIETERAAKVGAICYARVTDYHGQDALELYQQISGTAPMEHFGYLVSVVTWEAEGYKVLEQRLETEI